MKKEEFKKVIIHTMDKDIVITKKSDLIDLATRELKNDIEVNDGISEIHKHNPNYPTEIKTYSNAVDYMVEYWEDSYGDIAKLKETKAYKKEKQEV